MMCLTPSPPAPAADLAKLAEAIRSASRRAAADLILIGTLLGRVRDALPRGEWSPWCARELGWSQATVYRFLAVAAAFGRLADASLARFDPTALYALAQLGTPPAARAWACQLAEGGHRVTRAAALEILDAHRPGSKRDGPGPHPLPPAPAGELPERRPPRAEGDDDAAPPALAALRQMLSADAMLHLARAADADTGEPAFTGRLYPAGGRRADGGRALGAAGRGRPPAGVPGAVRAGQAALRVPPQPGRPERAVGRLPGVRAGPATGAAAEEEGAGAAAVTGAEPVGAATGDGPGEPAGG